MAYCKQNELGVYNLLDRVECPIQPDSTKFSRKYCWAQTDRSVSEVAAKIVDVTTNLDIYGIQVMKTPFPFYPSQDSLAYLDRVKGTVIFFHEDGKLWTVAQFNSVGLNQILKNPNTIFNPPVN